MRNVLSRRAWLGGLGSAALLRGQGPPEAPVEWICPMDPDVRERLPGQCPRCKMDLVAGLPEFEEYPLRVEVTPRAWRAGSRVRMRFAVEHPKGGAPVRDFVMVHERLFHLFLVSGDLEYFAHEHPEPQPDGTFLFETVFPKGGFYRLLGDFYPRGGRPQLVVQTLVSAGAAGTRWAAPKLGPVLSDSRAENLKVRLRTEPAVPIAGLKTLLFFEVDPAERLEPFLGAWGHLLVASADLIDLVHTHPFLADGGPKMQFNVVFPRAGMHRIWPQFQRAGVVNTARFDVAVREL